MQQNILRESNVTKIYLIYKDNGMRKKYAVKLRFMDNKECYFATDLPIQFSKPKRKTPIELNVYTIDGIYKTEITLIDTSVSLNEVLFEVSIPKKWNFIQLRQSTRKEIQLPLTITFNDGFTINATTIDLSLGGVAFYVQQDISSIYKKLSGILTLELPKNTIINFSEGKLVVETKFVREKLLIDEGKILYSFKFIGISLEDETVLKNFLIGLN